ncbi:MAG: lipopolysaccharide kinase InaA family protein [Pseudonocardiaceae bacterium]
MRLALLCLALLDRHTVDGNGRCQYCRTPRESYGLPHHVFSNIAPTIYGGRDSGGTTVEQLDRDTDVVNAQPPDVVRLAAHVGYRLGQASGGAELVADRRGSRVYRIGFATGDVALKIASHNTDDQGVREAENLAHREAAALTHLHDFAPGYLIESGDLHGGGSWLALSWLDGIPPTGSSLRLDTATTHPPGATASSAPQIAVAGRLAQLHGLGWLHADLQPAHILLAPTTVNLIDFALAQGPHPLQPD